MNYDDLEVQIQTRITPAFTTGTVEILLLPETELAFNRAFAKPRITIVYSNSEFGKVNSTGQISQDETQNVRLVIESKLKRGDLGIHDLFDRVRKKIIGFAPTGCTPFYAVSFDYEENDKGIWCYIFTIACKDLLVEDYDDDQDIIIPNLNTVQTNETITEPT